MEVLHISCNMGTRDLPDMYALSPRACGPRASGHTYISGKSLVPMLQLIHRKHRGMKGTYELAKLEFLYNLEFAYKYFIIRNIKILGI